MRKSTSNWDAKRMVVIIRPLMIFVCVIAVGVFSAWSIFGVFNDDIYLFRYLNFFGYFVPVVTLFIVLFLFLFVSKKSGAFSFFIGLPALVLPYYLVGFDGVEPELDYSQLDLYGSNDLNIYKVVSFSKMSINKSFSLMSQQLNCDEYDVVIIQEASGMEEYLGELGNLEWSRCNYAFSKNGFFAVLSKYKVELIADHHYFGGFDVYSPTGILSIVNLRLDKPVDEKGYQAQKKEMNVLMGFVQKSFVGKPVVVAGDFNATPFNMVVQSLSRIMDYAGSVDFLGFTFPADGRRVGVLFPVLRIDHIFKSGVKVSKFKVDERSYGSDHYPISFYVSL